MKRPILSWNSQDSHEKVKKCLQEEKMFIGSTDTILGLFSAPTENGFNSLRKLKNRENKPFLLLVSSPNCIKKFINDVVLFQVEKLSEKFWPGPLTIVCKARFDAPEYLVSKEGTIAFRMPKHAGIQMLLKLYPMIFSTSANKAGKLPAQTLEDLDQELLNKVEYLIVDDQNENKLPSTIIKCDESGDLFLIREGAIPFTKIQKLMNRRG